MQTPDLLKEVSSLPIEAQKQILDFIDFIKTRYPAEKMPSNRKKIKLSDEPFIGMWQERDDMKDSSEWVRHLRQREWEVN